MVGRWRDARSEPHLAGRALLSLFRIERPTEEQEAGALLLGEFLVKTLHFLPWPE